jgi:hypothetical protein
MSRTPIGRASRSHPRSPGEPKYVDIDEFLATF